MSEQTGLEEQIKAQTARYLNMRLWVVHSRPSRDISELAPYVYEHFEFVEMLSAQGIMFAAGPFVGENRRPTGEGMFILRADTSLLAEEIASQDPFHKAGVREWELREWFLNVGSMTAKLNFANQTAQIE